MRRRSPLTAWRTALALLALSVAAPASASVGVEDALADAAARAVRQFRRDTGSGAALHVLPVQVEERLEDRAPPFPFERGAERVEAFRLRREADVRAVSADWLAATGATFLPERLTRAVADERTGLRPDAAAARAVRTRIGLTYAVDAWDFTDERFLPVRMVLRSRVRFELLDAGTDSVLATYESGLLDDLVYEPGAEVLHVSTEETAPASRHRRRRYDLTVRVRVTHMMGRVATVGFCMEGDTDKNRSMHLRWGPMDTVAEEFDVTFSDVEEPPVWRRKRVDVRVWVAQGFGTRQRKPGPCEARAPDAELTYVWRRVR